MSTTVEQYTLVHQIREQRVKAAQALVFAAPYFARDDMAIEELLLLEDEVRKPLEVLKIMEAMLAATDPTRTVDEIEDAVDGWLDREYLRSEIDRRWPKEATA